MYIIFIYIHKHNIHYMSEVGGCVYDSVLNGCQPRAWPCSYTGILSYMQSSICRVAGVPSRTACPVVGGVCGHVNSGKGLVSVYTHTHTHTYSQYTFIYVCVCVCVACVWRVGRGCAHLSAESI